MAGSGADAERRHIADHRLVLSAQLAVVWRHFGLEHRQSNECRLRYTAHSSRSADMPALHLAFIRVGVYDSETVERAAAFTSAGERWQDDMVIVK
jgi:hypothetical protein